MDDLAPPPPRERKKLTVLLIAGGVASLLLPLLAAVYLKMTESGSAPGPSGRSDLFEQREGSEVKLTPTQAVVIPKLQGVSPVPFAGGRPAPTGGSSLDFIKGTDDLRARAQTPPPASAPAAAQTPPPPAEPAPAAESKTTAKNAKKAFSAPKLQPSRGFSGFTSGKDRKTGPQGAGAPGPQGMGGGQDMSEALKNLPGGAGDDPRLKEYLKKQGK